MFSEQNPNVTTFGVLRDRIVATGLDKKITGGAVLDAGCGAWQKGTRILRSFGPARIDAVDFNERSLAHCRADPQENTTYSRQDLQQLNFPDASFDFIICEGVVHHTLHPEKTMAELVRVLKPGGVLTLGLYCWRFPYTFARWLMRNTFAKIIRFQRFLDLSGHNKPMLLLADFIYVPIEHTMKLGRTIEWLQSNNCKVVYNDSMGWPLPLLGSRTKWLFRWAGVDYRHVFAVKS